jgi:hypothetical protein
VMVNQAGDRLVMIDFDWAGKEGQVLYPPFLNPDIPRPAGVQSGKLIKKQHDLDSLSIIYIKNMNVTIPQKRAAED